MKTSASKGIGINSLFEKIGEIIMDPNNKFKSKKQKNEYKIDNHENTKQNENKNISNNYEDDESETPNNKNIKISNNGDDNKICCL